MSVFQAHKLRQENDSPIEIWFGIFSKNVSDLSEMCYVILPDFSEDHELGPCFWQSRDADSLPARGDRCAVVTDNQDNVWVIAWWPYA